MKSFLRAVEVWQPSPNGQTLVFADGLYGELAAFRSASMAATFGFDEGLPGKAWAQRQPIILRSFQNSYFKRTAIAHESGITCGIALPLFQGEELKAVTVFFCGDDEDHVGAIESWLHDPRRWGGIRLEEGYFGAAETYEWRARNTEYMKGFDLAGEVWAREAPVFSADLGASFRNLRPDDDRKVGVNKGLGLPCFGDPRGFRVMVFRSALGTPIARRFEIWTPDDNGRALTLAAGDGGDSVPAVVTSAAGEGPIGKALQSGRPCVSHDLRAETSAACAAAAQAGMTTMIALPVHDASRVRSVVTMYF